MTRWSRAARWLEAAREELVWRLEPEPAVVIPMSADRAREELNRRAEELLDRHGNAILRYAYSYLHNMSDAEEVLQDTMIQFLKAAPQFDGPSHEKAWLLRVAGNLSKNRLDYNARRSTDELKEELAAPEDRRRAPAAWRRWGAMAACLAVVIAGGLALPHLLPQNGTEDPPVMTGPGTEEMDSRAALEQAVGFSVEEAEHLPFAPQEVLYTAFDSGLAQVEYRGENGQTALLRKSQGTEDNSGDFDQYPDVKTLDTAGIDVTLKGAEGQFTLALWQEDGFSYSLSLSQGQDAQGWAEILSDIR